MPSYHVIVNVTSDEREKVQLDLTPEQLEEHVVKPFTDGRSIEIDGTSIASSDIVCLRIAEATRATSAIRGEISQNPYRQLMSSDFVDRYIANEGEDVTDHFITPCAS